MDDDPALDPTLDEPALDETGLNLRQEHFCREYVLDPNGARAAVKAGYEPRSAHVQASRLLRNDKVQTRIGDLRADIARRHGVRADVMIGKLEAVFRQAYETCQPHAAVRAVELQARLAGLIGAPREVPGRVIDATAEAAGPDGDQALRQPARIALKSAGRG